VLVQGVPLGNVPISPDNGHTAYLWVVKGKMIPVKLESADGSYGVIYRNVRAGNPPDSVFEIPEGYTSMSAGMQGMDLSALMKGR
jgi:hypothetical protein